MAAGLVRALLSAPAPSSLKRRMMVRATRALSHPKRAMCGSVSPSLGWHLRRTLEDLRWSQVRARRGRARARRLGPARARRGPRRRVPVLDDGPALTNEQLVSKHGASRKRARAPRPPRSRAAPRRPSASRPPSRSRGARGTTPARRCAEARRAEPARVPRQTRIQRRRARSDDARREVRATHRRASPAPRARRRSARESAARASARGPRRSRAEETRVRARRGRPSVTRDVPARARLSRARPGRADGALPGPLAERLGVGTELWASSRPFALDGAPRRQAVPPHVRDASPFFPRCRRPHAYAASRAHGQDGTRVFSEKKRRNGHGGVSGSARRAARDPHATAYVPPTSPRCARASRRRSPSPRRRRRSSPRSRTRTTPRERATLAMRPTRPSIGVSEGCGPRCRAGRPRRARTRRRHPGRSPRLSMRVAGRFDRAARLGADPRPRRRKRLARWTRRGRWRRRRRGAHRTELDQETRSTGPPEAVDPGGRGAPPPCRRPRGRVRVRPTLAVSHEPDDDRHASSSRTKADDDAVRRRRRRPPASRRPPGVPAVRPAARGGRPETPGVGARRPAVCASPFIAADGARRVIRGEGGKGAFVRRNERGGAAARPPKDPSPVGARAPAGARSARTPGQKTADALAGLAYPKTPGDARRRLR